MSTLDTGTSDMSTLIPYSIRIKASVKKKLVDLKANGLPVTFFIRKALEELVNYLWEKFFGESETDESSSL